MNSVPMLLQNAITGLNHLDQRPVFFVKLNGSQQTSIVIKGEVGAGNDVELSVKWGSKFMKNINDNQVNTKILNPLELVEFRRAATLYGDPTKMSYNSINAPNTTWVKMPFIAGISDADTWDDNGRKSTQELKDLISRFTNPQVWIDLGKVLAVDLFNGNNDRFDTQGTWVNRGNVMFAPHAVQGIKVVGLDTYQPQNATSNLVGHGRFPELSILVDANARTKYAFNVTRSITSAISSALFVNGVHKVTVGFGVNMFHFEKGKFNPFANYITDLENGIIAGANELKLYLQRKKAQYARENNQARGFVMGGTRGARGANVVPQAPGKTIPAGVLDRMAFLGW